MILFFNLEALEKAAQNDSRKLISLIKEVNSLNKAILAPIHRKILAGSSFLLNAEDLLANRSVDINYIVQYIKLAGRRDYALYKLYGVKSLPLSYFPDIDLNKINHNPLLNITQSDIHFKYER